MLHLEGETDCWTVDILECIGISISVLLDSGKMCFSCLMRSSCVYTKPKTISRVRTQNSYYPYEPFQVLGDGNCIYCGVSKALFGNMNKWDLIKLGSLSYLKSETDAVLQYVRDSTLTVNNFPKL